MSTPHYSRKRKASDEELIIDEQSIISNFQKYVDKHIGPNPLVKDNFDARVNNTYQLTVYNFKPLMKKILNGQRDMMDLLNLLYNYYFNNHRDENGNETGDKNFVVLVGQCVPKDSTLDYYGPKNSEGKGVFPRYIPEDTIYFHLLATIHMNIESLVETYYQLDGLDFLNNLLMKAMEENSLTGKYLMLDTEYKSLFGTQVNKFNLGVHNVTPFVNLDEDSERTFNKLKLNKTQWEKLKFNELSNTSLQNKVSETFFRARPMNWSGYTARGDTARGDHHNKRGRTGPDGGRRTRKYRRKTRTKKKLRKCKTHKKRKTRHGRK